MPAPCSTGPSPPIGPHWHKVVVLHRHFAQGAHHVWHRAHHAVHTLGASSTACQLLPKVLAAIALGMLAPPAQVALLRSPDPPAIEPLVLSPEASPIGVSGLGIISGGGIWAPAPAASVAPADPAADTTPGPLASPVGFLVAGEVLAQPSVTQVPDAYSPAADPAPSIIAAGVEPASGLGLTVPEPSSLAILAAAACVAGLIKRRSAGRRDPRAHKLPP